MRTETWKYVKWSYGDEELYDLKADPSELHNLAALPAYAARKAELAKLASGAPRLPWGEGLWGAAGR